jgi:hypothetical protein
MSTISSFRDLLVWQKAMDLAVGAHDVARTFPNPENFVLGRLPIFNTSGWRTLRVRNWRHKSNWEDV